MSTVEWMTTLPDPVRDLALINLSIPGSHNSMTFGITSDSNIAPDANKSTRRLYRFFPAFVRRWAKTQSVNVTIQMEMGIRYFDLRICQLDDKFYYVHGLYANEVFDPLRELRDFLDAHPGEVAVLDFQHFYNFRPMHHMQLHADLLKFFGKRFYTPADGRLLECTLNRCKELGRQVVLIYRRCPVQMPREFWPSHSWPTPWPNVSSTKKLRTFLEDSLLSRKAAQGYVSQCILTPTGRYIALRFLSSLRNTAKKVDKKMYPWIENQIPGPFKPKETPKVNVFLADFVNLKNGQFCKWVIGLNTKILNDLPTLEMENGSVEALKAPNTDKAVEQDVLSICTN